MRNNKGIPVEIFDGYVDNVGASIKTKPNGIALTYEQLADRDQIIFKAGMAYMVDKGPTLEEFKKLCDAL